jgi:HK97 family phage major capsid protein
MSTVKELREKRARAHAFALSQLSGTQTREKKDAFDRAMSECDVLGEDIKRYERAGTTGSSGYAENRERDPWTSERECRAAWAFGKFLRKGYSALDEDEAKSLTEKRAEEEGNLQSQVGSYTGLGFFVPTGFVYDVEQALKYYAPLMDICGRLDTATGNPLPYPTSNDTAFAARVIGESTDATSGSTDLTASHILFAAWKYTTDVIKVSLELAQDSAFPLEQWLADRFSERLGRGYERDFTKGDGSNKPTGLLTDLNGSGATPIVANGSAETSGGSETGANSIGYSDLVRLEHSVDPAYRRGAQFMFHDTTLSQLKRILDKFGRPLWVPGMKEGAPDTINGYAFVVNQSMPTVAQSHAAQIGSLNSIQNSSVLFGDLKKFVIRRVKGLSVQRLHERYAEFGQVGYVAFARVDSRLVDAGTHPISGLVQA